MILSNSNIIKHTRRSILILILCVFFIHHNFAQESSTISIIGKTKERIDQFDKKNQIKQNVFKLEVLSFVNLEVIVDGRPIKKVVSDAQGNFTLEFDIKQNSIYDLKYSKSGFYPKISRFKTLNCEKGFVYSFDNWNISLRKTVSGLNAPSKLIPFEIYFYDQKEEAFEIDYEYELDYNKIAEELYAKIAEEVKTNDAFSELKATALNELKAELMVMQDNVEEQSERKIKISNDKLLEANKKAKEIINNALDSAQVILNANKRNSEKTRVEYIYIPIDSSKTTIKSEQVFKQFKEKKIDSEGDLNLASVNIMRRKDEVEKAIKQLEIDKLLAKTKEDSMLISQRQMEIEEVTNSIETYEARVKEANAKLDMQSYQLQTQRMYLYGGLVVLIIIIGFLGIVYRLLKQKQKVNQLLKTKNKLIEEIHNDVVSSIRYAQRIQTAILPPKEFIESKVQNEYFVLYKPKDIVSGDFYWVDEKNKKILISAIDCTGHGVPGAFMSMIGYNSLNKAVKEYGLTQPADILNALNKFISEALRKSTNKTIRDGMDMSFISIDYENNVLEYAGAYNPLYIIRNNELIHVKSDNIPIGSFFQYPDRKFTNHIIPILKGDCIYVFTDGFADQFGGPDFRKFMYRNFKELLLNIHQKPMEKQEELLWEELCNWKGEEEQIDDICVIGIKI